MRSAILTVAALATGLFMASLSYKFLTFLANEAPDNRNGEKHLCVANRFRITTGILLIAFLAGIATSSTKIAAIATAIPFTTWALTILWSSRQRNKRHSLINRELPILLDYLVLQVESGHSVQQALQSASGLLTCGGPLRMELRELENSLRRGLSIVQGMEKFRLRLGSDTASVPVLAIAQAIQHGTPLGKTLREQSKRMRDNLILQGEEFANTVSVKILIPLLFFVFPASFLVIFSPVIVSLSGRLP